MCVNKSVQSFSVIAVETKFDTIPINILDDKLVMFCVSLLLGQFWDGEWWYYQIHYINMPEDIS